MASYTDPTGTVSGTSGDDTIILDAPPTVTTTIDALSGNDTLDVHFNSPNAMRVDVSFNGNSFDTEIYVDPFVPFYALHVENVGIQGTANDDNFSIHPGTTGYALPLSFDGAAGQDTLHVLGSDLTTAISFVVNGSTATSGLGTFSNFENFDIRAGSGDDTITTGAGDDAVETGTGIDHVSTGAGNDSIYIESLGGSFDAGDGNDWVSLTVIPNSSPYSVDGGAGVDELHLDWENMAVGQSFVFDG